MNATQKAAKRAAAEVVSELVKFSDKRGFDLRVTDAVKRSVMVDIERTRDELIHFGLADQVDQVDDDKDPIITERMLELVAGKAMVLAIRDVWADSARAHREAKRRRATKRT